MAGLYADAPGLKMQYDLDGSAGFSALGAAGAINVLSATDLAQFNDETDNNVVSGLLNGFYYLQGIIFPELRDIVAFGYRQTMSDNAYAVQTSADTTNGEDGSWTTRETIDAGGATTSFAAVSPTFRTLFRGTGGVADATLPYNGVKSIRFLGNNSNAHGNNISSSLHLYGTPSAGLALDRLRIWHATLDQAMGAAGLDYGDFGRGGTIDRTFRIKNNSSSLTANSIVLSIGALTDASPTVLGQQTISQGGAFATTQNIGALAPGAISAVCTLRIASTSSTVLGAWRQRLIATAGSWT